MLDKDLMFPRIEKSITDFINDEDGNITRSKLVSIGSMILLMSILSIDDVFAVHGSHSSHSSHESHSSTSYIRDHSNHGSHSNHNSHSSHSSHSSHTSHSNTASHSNSIYSEEGDVEYGPKASEIPKILESPINNSDVFEETNISGVGAAKVNNLDMDVPQQPDIENGEATKDTGLEFENSAAVDILGKAAAIGGAGAITAGGIGSAKMGIDAIRDKSKSRRKG